ncbi:MmgE/PrpD family protein [Colwellia sp. PAMC 21821]|uniref:MmgE/PrpD family protein n=1 Tax=Colwellia sp. PAMC 21821 TaxID=1816219 RepID=UPI0009BF3C3C|nr:MmgE/PrpD family protein [Colwellia sp. PAMC 21821]ARD43541.1 2-methylcitrate dehydratase [Colwellia sp. PAMC 21821]
MALTVSKFIQTLRYQDIPENVLAVMRRSLLDTIGVAAIGTTTKISGIVKEFARTQMPAGVDSAASRLLFSGLTISPVGAAMAGAFTIDSIDAHDGYSKVKGHAGSGIFPAVIAVIDDLTRQGKEVNSQDLFVALTIGYEVGYRSGLCMHGTVPDYHTSGAWTAVGAAAAAAYLLKLDEEQIRHAIGIAEYHGPRSQMMRCIDHPTMLRDGVGWGAPSGVSAAYMAQLGFTGAPAITAEGEDAKPYWDDLGERWEVNNTHYKAYPVCRWAHPAIDAVHDLMINNRLVSDDIERARIKTFHYATRLAGHAPKTMDELTYALAYPFAIMAVHGEIGPKQLQESILQDKEVQRISLATELVDDEHYTAISIDKRWADVTLYLKDGRELQSDARTPRGDPDNPLTDKEISDKFHLLADDIIGVKRANKIEQLIEEVNFDLTQLLILITDKC